MALGFPHPDYLMEGLTSKQLSDWEIYYAVEPFGEEAEWSRIGRDCSLLINLKLKEGKEQFTPFDFMPELYEGKRSRMKQTSEDHVGMMRSMIKKEE